MDARSWSASRAALAAADYGSAALLRVAVRDDGRRLAVGAHHGAVDGLGLVAVAGRRSASRCASEPGASGTGRPGPASCARAWRGWARPWSTRRRGSPGRGDDSPVEDLSELTRPLVDRGTAHLAAAAARVFGDRGHDGPTAARHRRVAAVGHAARGRSSDGIPAAARACRRRRRTTYAARSAAVDPEPDFPATSVRGIGPRVAHLLRRRLGATALLSNLGLIDGPLDSIAMFPACSGPRAVAVGLASTRSTTTLSLRTRRTDFTADEHAGLLADLASAFFPVAAGSVGVVGRVVSEQPGNPTQPEPQQDLQADVAQPPGQLAHDPEPVGEARPAPLEQRHRAGAAYVGEVSRPEARAAGCRASRRSRRRRRGPGPRRPRAGTTASAGRRRRSTRRACRRCRRGRHRRSSRGRACVEYSSTWRTTVATPARSRLARNFSRVDSPPNSRPSTNGSIAITSPPAARATWPSRTVERPWWLPISSRRAPGPAAAASSNNSRPWSLVSQPGTGSARAQATSKSGGDHAGSGAGIVARQGVGAPRNRGYTHARHSTGSRGSVIATSEATVTRPPRPEHGRQRWRERWRRSWSERSAAGWAVLATYAWLVAMAFLQRPGETTFDTKFDLTSDVERFLVQSLSLWKQDSNFGELQNQAYGYLFPQGAFFLLGDNLGVPDWVVQRAWTALLLVVAFEGARRLWQALRPEASPWSAWVAGIAFATAPRLLGLVGVLSAEILPTAVLPWVVLPIVLAQQGRVGVRAGALWSGVAVLFIGGVNAVENLAALPLPLFVVLSTLGRPGGGRLVRWWLGATALASAWWMLPLLVLGRYSPPFLDYIETSAAVVRPLGWTNVARGADHWVSYVFVGGDPWWPGSYELSTDSAAHRGDRGRGRGRSVGADPDPDAAAPAVAAEPAAGRGLPDRGPLRATGVPAAEPGPGPARRPALDAAQRPQGRPAGAAAPRPGAGAAGHVPGGRRPAGAGREAARSPRLSPWS